MTPENNPSLPNRFVPESTRFVIRLADGDDGTLGVVYPEHGPVRFARGSYGIRVLESELRAPSHATSNDPCVSFDETLYREMTLTPRDDDGDDIVDWLYGRVTGEQYVWDADFGFYQEFRGTFEATPDRTPPALVPRRPIVDAHVLDGIGFGVTEPLRQEVTARLRTSTGAVVELLTEGDPLWPEFHWPYLDPIPFGVTYTLELDRPLEDMAGNVAPADPVMVQTMANPGVLAEDGFEGPVNARLTGSADIVTSVGTTGAITGTRSLLVAPSSRVTMRVPVSPGETTMRMSVRILHDPAGELSLYLDVRSPLLQSAAPDFWTQAYDADWTGTLEETGDARWPQVSGIFEVQASLPPDTTDFVYLDITVFGGEQCAHFGLPRLGALLIDDVRVE